MSESQKTVFLIDFARLTELSQTLSPEAYEFLLAMVRDFLKSPYEAGSAASISISHGSEWPWSMFSKSTVIETLLNDGIIKRNKPETK